MPLLKTLNLAHQQKAGLVFSSRFVFLRSLGGRGEVLFGRCRLLPFEFVVLEGHLITASGRECEIVENSSENQSSTRDFDRSSFSVFNGRVLNCEELFKNP
jgi:hypothetical protein